MKPRTKLEKRVTALSTKLPPITQAQMAWVRRNAFRKLAYRCKKDTWCLSCGSVFVGNNSQCPHCGTKIKTSDCRKFKAEERVYTTIHTTCKGFQVIRHCVANRISRKGQKTVFWINECVQIWINEAGKQTIMARPCSISFYNDMWNWYSPLSIKRPSISSWYCRGNRYEILAHTNRICRVLPLLRRNGFRGEFHEITPSTLFSQLLTSNTAEWLLKTGQYSLLQKFCKGGVIRYPHAVNICNRNGYTIQDADVWCDYIDLLMYFHKDTHSPKYVCPPDLTGAHDKLVERKRRAEHRKELSKKRKEIAEWEEGYRKEKSMYFGICFGNKDITVSVLASVMDFDSEGFAMHHCVFANEYFKKKDSLILSARDKQGNRLETVELSTETWQVLQSRGKFNKVTPEHDRIVKLVQRNIKLFREVAKS